jgi:hypothetical protein
MQPSETGFNARNREFSNNFRPKQASGLLVAAGQSNFDRNPNQLTSTAALSCYCAKQVDLSATTGDPMLDIRLFKPQNR